MQSTAKKHDLLKFTQIKPGVWLSDRGYRITLLQANMYRSERYKVCRHGKFIGLHVTIDDAKLQCDALEGNIQ